MGYSVEVRERALGLLRQGWPTVWVSREVGAHNTTVGDWARLAGMKLQKGALGGIPEFAEPRRRRRRPRGPAQAPEGPYVDGAGRLTLEARVVIGIRRRERCSMRRIATELGVAASTVSRELARGSIEGHYQARRAQRAADQARSRPKIHVLDARPALRREVLDRLRRRHSPEQIAGALRREFPDDHAMRVSHETIYQALYVQGAGSLRHELAVEKATRQGRTHRRPRSKLGPRSNRSWIGDAVITARPAEAIDRAIPGHWEGDLVISGIDQRSALITLNERTSRFTLISRIDVHDTSTVTTRLAEMIATLPREIIKTITWDQGVEMANHAQFTIATGCPVFFCDPHSPWQRPTNENSNGLIRDFYPKGTNFATIPDDDIAHTQFLLNTRPRKVLDYATPAEILDNIINVAMTT